MLDRFDQRVLGGIKVVDHLSGQQIRAGITIKAPGLQLVQSASGIWAVFGATGMQDYSRSFDPVPAQAARNFDIEVHDHQRRFDPIATTIRLPRDADKDAVTNRVDTPIEIAMPSAAGRAAQAGWSLIIVEVLTTGDAPVAGALVQVFDHGTTNERGWALTGARGQAVVPLVGLAHMQDAPAPGGGGGGGGGGQPATVTAVTNLAVQITADPDQPWPANPTHLRSGDAALRSVTTAAPVALTAGGEASIGLSLTLS